MIRKYEIDFVGDDAPMLAIAISVAIDYVTDNVSTDLAISIEKKNATSYKFTFEDVREDSACKFSLTDLAAEALGEAQEVMPDSVEMHVRELDFA
jgi:hypothetical protein